MASSMTSAENDPIDLFAQRLWERDHPVVAPLRFDRASVLERIRAGIAARELAPTRAGQVRLARILYAFLGQAEWTAAGLGAEVGCVESRLRTLLRGLRKAEVAGLRRLPENGRQMRYYLTRAGEDWLQSLVQAPSAKPPEADSTPPEPH